MQSSYVLLVIAIAAVFADPPRISVSQSCSTPASCPILLTAGLDTNVKFTLSQPIVCDASVTAECNVVVLLTSSDDKVRLDPCYVKWTSKDWFTAKSVNIKAIPNPNNPLLNTDVITITTAPATSPAAFYSNFDANDLLIKAANQPSSQCRATGDPHYTTLDGAYWHFYDGNNNGGASRAKTIVNLVKTTNPNRPYGSLNVQNQVRGYPATNCAMLGREGNDLVIIDVCSGILRLTTRFGPDAATHPKIEVTGSTYTVYFSSGFWMRAETSSYYMNVYVQVPGLDAGNVCGMCGNFDGNAANDYLVYQTTLYSQLPLCNQVDLATEDLAAWQPSAVVPTAAAGGAAPGAGCNYPNDGYLQPILNNAAGSDITEQLQAAAADLANNDNNVIFVAPINPPITPANAAVACDAAWTASAVATQCVAAFGSDSPDWIIKTARLAECAQDVVALSSYDAANDMIVGLTVDCSKHAKGLNIAALDNVLCLNSCSGHGTCGLVNGAPKCACTAPFGEADCSYDASKPAKVTGQYETTCDKCGADGCPAGLVLTGENFHSSANLRCLVGGQVTTAVYLGAKLVVCDINAASHKDDDDHTPAHVNVQVTNDYTDNAHHASNAVPFTFYCSDCQSCARLDQTCAVKADICNINSKCHANHEVNPAQACQVCDSAVSTSAWTVSLANSHVCGPKFSAPTYSYNIHCAAQADDVIVSPASAVNPLTGVAVTYTLEHSLLSVNGVVKVAGDRFFKVNAATGVISAAVDITYATLTGGMDYQAGNPLTYDGFFQVVASDGVNFAEANVVVGLKGIVAADGSCTQDAQAPSFSGSVVENAPVGTQVVQVTEVLPGDKTFTMWFADINGAAASVFAVDAVTGWVSVAGPLSAAAKNSYHLQVQVTDATGLWFVSEVFVTVTAINHAPTDISLSPSAIPELPAGATAGTLSATDAEGGAMVFSIAAGAVGATKFTIVGNVLTGLDRFHYDAGETSVTVAVTVTDAGGLSFTKTLTVAVTPVNEPPFNLLLQASAADATPVTGLAEDLAVGSDVGVVVASDPEGNAYDCQVAATTPTGPGGSLLFELHGANMLQLMHPLDFEAAASVSVVVMCTDNQAANFLSAPATFVLALSDVPEPPTITLTQPSAVAENQVGAIEIGTIVGRDQDSESVTLEIYDTAFTLGETNCERVGAGCVCTASLTAVVPLDFETIVPGQTVVEVLAVDDGGLATTDFVTVLVKDVNDVPNGATVTIPDGAATITEHSPVGTIVAHVTITDPDAVFEVDSVSIPVGGAFAIGAIISRRDSQRTYAIVVADAAQVMSPIVTFDLEVADADGTTTFARLTLAVHDTPLVLQYVAFNNNLFLDELATVGTVVGTLTILNYDSVGDEEVNWALATPAGANAVNFRIVPDLTVKSVAYVKIKAVGLDWETAPNHQVTFVPTVTIPDLASDLEANKQLISITVVVTLSDNYAELPTLVVPAGNLVTYLSRSATGTVLGQITTATPGVTFAVNATSSSLTASNIFPLLAVTINAAGQVLVGSAAPTVVNYPQDLTKANKVSVFVTKTMSGKSYTSIATLTIQFKEACAVNTCSGACLDCGYIPAFGNQKIVSPNAYGAFVATSQANYATFCPGNTAYYCQGAVGGSSYATPQASTDGGAGASATTTTATTVGAVVGVVGGCAMLLVIVVIVVVRRRSTAHVQFLGKDSSSSLDGTSVSNPAFVLPSSSSGMAAGLDNPMYEWYQPSMTRKDCAAYLQTQPEGAFVIRDSAATPGWHMLAIKTGGDIVHEKIRFTEDGQYELLPTAETAKEQPKFASLPALVEHYSSVEQADAPYHLAQPQYILAGARVQQRAPAGYGYLHIEPMQHTA